MWIYIYSSGKIPSKREYVGRRLSQSRDNCKGQLSANTRILAILVILLAFIWSTNAGILSRTRDKIISKIPRFFRRAIPKTINYLDREYPFLERKYPPIKSSRIIRWWRSKEIKEDKEIGYLMCRGCQQFVIHCNTIKDEHEKYWELRVGPTRLLSTPTNPWEKGNKTLLCQHWNMYVGYLEEAVDSTEPKFMIAKVALDSYGVTTRF